LGKGWGKQGHGEGGTVLGAGALSDGKIAQTSLKVRQSGWVKGELETFLEGATCLQGEKHDSASERWSGRGVIKDSEGWRLWEGERNTLFGAGSCRSRRKRRRNRGDLVGEGCGQALSIWFGRAKGGGMKTGLLAD